MPNHVINEVIFRNIDAETRATLLANIKNVAGEIDFEILMPAPLNIWCGGVSTRHSVFPGNHLDWARANWGTKWNAYGLDEGGKYKSILQTEDSLTLTFQTAWRPPYGWLIAIFNRFKINFEHNWLDEGAARGNSGKFDYAALDDRLQNDPWKEEEASDEMHRHLHTLLWGVESFPDEGEAA